MVTTNTEAKRQGKSSGGKRKKKRGDDGGVADRPSANGGAEPAGDKSGAEDTGPRRSLRVGARAAAGRLRGLAEESESLAVRRHLRRVARQVEQGRGNVRQVSFTEAAISGCLDEAETHEAVRERWLLCEAAAWGLGWLAQCKRAGGSAGGMLERLVKAARGAQGPLASGDTLPARFAVTLAGLFADVDICRSLDREAMAAVQAEIARLVSAEGAVGLRGSAAILERIVRWAGVREVAAATGAPAWNDATEKSFGAAVATAVRLLGDKGRGLTGAGRLPASCSDSLLAAAVGSDRKRVRRTAEFVQAGKSGGRRHRRDAAAAEKLLPRDQHDAASATAIIRSGWGRQAIRVLVQYRDTLPHLEIAVGDRLLVDGAWGWSAAADGRGIEAEGPWKLSCFESDKKATFLEIVAPLPDGLQIDRQIVLLPHDRILVLADAITKRAADSSVSLPFPQEGLQLTSEVPLTAGLEGKMAKETREVFVRDTKPRIMALPLGLPEWRSAGSGGLEATVAGLRLEQRSAGCRVYAPLWLDLDPDRHGKPLTWRQLTVADTRQNLPPHQAIGFRVQSGLEQWLVYRSLDEPRNRTVLGCNLSCDFLIGPIGKTGVVDRAIEID